MVLIEALQTVAGEDLVVIRYGNRWLQCDPHGEHMEWVSDLARATTLSQGIGERVRQQGEDRRHSYEVFSYLDAVHQEQQAAKGFVFNRWRAEFESEIARLWPKKKFTRDGIDVNAHMFFGQGLAVSTAILHFAKSFKLTISFNRKPNRERRASRH